MEEKTMNIKRTNISPHPGEPWMGWDLRMSQDEALSLMEALNAALHVGHTRVFQVGGDHGGDGTQITIMG